MKCVLTFIHNSMVEGKLGEDQGFGWTNMPYSTRTTCYLTLLERDTTIGDMIALFSIMAVLN